MWSRFCRLPVIEAVGDADAVAAPDELFGEMGADEAGAAGDEVEKPCS